VLLKTNPKADTLPLVALTGPNGKYTPNESGFNGGFLIPKTVPEDKLKKILEFMNYGASEDGYNLANYGFKDIHYVEQDGFKKATEQAKTDILGTSVFGQIFPIVDKYQRAFLVGMPKSVYERNKGIVDERAKYAVPDASNGLISETNLKLGKEFAKKIQDLKSKIIVGKAPIEEWDAYVKQLQADADYQKITKEMNDAYAENQKLSQK
jgi:putative aldouronate transport system substrate-binding protein